MAKKNASSSSKKSAYPRYFLNKIEGPDWDHIGGMIELSANWPPFPELEGVDCPLPFESLWSIALIGAHGGGDRRLLCAMLRSELVAEVPQDVRKHLADFLDGKTQWSNRRLTRAQELQHVVRHFFEQIRLQGFSSKSARSQLAKKFSLSEETIRDIVEKRKTFRGDKGKHSP